MSSKTILIMAILVTAAACDFINSSDEPDSDIFGAWYNIESTGHEGPSPELRITGWYISDESQTEGLSAGSVHPVGINGNSGQAALIDSRYTPSHELQIHEITSDKIIVEYIVHSNLASSMGIHKTDHPDAVSDLVLEIDTVAYKLTETQLILDGRYYKGTYNRTALGNKLSDPAGSEFTVSINGDVHENLRISETMPSAYISKFSENDFRIISRMGWNNIAIDIPGFHGPGTYILGKEQASVTPKGFDTLSPSFVTVADSSGYVTIENIDPDNATVTGNFEFTAFMGDSNEYSELSISLRNGSFGLPLFD